MKAAFDFTWLHTLEMVRSIPAIRASWCWTRLPSLRPGPTTSRLGEVTGSAHVSVPRLKSQKRPAADSDCLTPSYGDRQARYSIDLTARLPTAVGEPECASSAVGSSINNTTDRTRAWPVQFKLAPVSRSASSAGWTTDRHDQPAMTGRLGSIQIAVPLRRGNTGSEKVPTPITEHWH
ncbi:hypothetical protein RRG08_047924 [Elysia crispata]|uniref:Uncharacterized protein n=1 Tax=Elysia crispata TaxID=231223 RepID=A0AAE1DJG8_9GAST|nr:hypothetical protein RRG08_047924 [Elysia crispata]